MKTCVRCVLPETFPGVTFDADGVCNHCREFKGLEDLAARKAEFFARFEALVATRRGRGTYDAVMSYSGGKDSTYTLAILRETYDLNVLAVTLDNGFLPDETMTNIRRMAERLGFDHILCRPRFDVMKKIFAACADEDIYSLKTLSRASSICTSCISFVKFFVLRTAIEKGAPLIAFGWSPGQIPLASSLLVNNPEMVKASQKVVFAPLHKIAGDAIRPYFLEDVHWESSRPFPVNVSPLAFLDYDEERILEKVESLGWAPPPRVDGNSTNCLRRGSPRGISSMRSSDNALLSSAGRRPGSPRTAPRHETHPTPPNGAPLAPQHSRISTPDCDRPSLPRRAGWAEGRRGSGRMSGGAFAPPCALCATLCNGAARPDSKGDVMALWKSDQELFDLAKRELFTAVVGDVMD